MCLILLAWQQHVDYPLVLAANRDEFYERPTLPVDFWEDHPEILGGRDLKEGGTWLGVTRKGRFAALTNYRDPLNIKADAPSRGWLVRNFLIGAGGAKDYLTHLRREGALYNGFSIILGDMTGLHYFSNRGGDCGRLAPGVYGLSNHLLDTPWPKVRDAKQEFHRVVAKAGHPCSEDLFKVLEDRRRPGDHELPDTGIGLEWERVLSAIFIASPVYGTRSSTVLFSDLRQRLYFEERQFNGSAEAWMNTRFSFGS